MTQLNTPYPATAYLTGFLRSRGFDAHQHDLALALVLRLLSRPTLELMRERLTTGHFSAQELSGTVRFFLDHFSAYCRAIEPAVRFLQGKDPALAFRIAGGDFLPEGPRFDVLDAYMDHLSEEGGGDPLAWAFGALGVQDRARHLATLFINDVADVVREVLDPRFEFVRYGEKLARSQDSFDVLAEALSAPPSALDSYLQQLTGAVLQQHRPRVVLISVPFPGAVYGAFRVAQTVKALAPDVVTVLGGGFVNTELRQLAEPRVFDYFDYVTLDDGEAPLLCLFEFLEGRSGELLRTFWRDSGAGQGGKQESHVGGGGRVRYSAGSRADIPFSEVGTPTWEGLPLDGYLSVLDMLNPMHRLWSDGRWNKLTVAHGCYWKKCSFCDTRLDYISRFEALAAEDVVDRMERIMAETGHSGFHFVDEAAPPKALRALAEEILRRNLAVSWWGNVRFEKSFTPDLCQLLAESGCIAISGGLEVASDRLLQLMQKGVSVDQVARVTHAFSSAGILVHAYLMYGFPTQTVQDTVDALEYVRQLFAEGCLQSGFFHRFSCTVHSPVGQHPERYGIRLQPLPPIRFACNDVDFVDPSGVDHDRLGEALSRAIYNFMHGIGLEQDVRRWFDVRVPRPKVAKNFIANALRTQ